MDATAILNSSKIVPESSAAGLPCSVQANESMAVAVENDGLSVATRLADSFAEGCWIIDARGATITMNAAGARLLSCDPEDLRDRHHGDAVHSSLIEEVKGAPKKCPICTSIAESETRSGRLIFVARSDLHISIECFSTPLLEDGRVSGAMVLFRRAAPTDKGLESMQADVYRSLFENGVEGMFRMSAKGEFIAVNMALARLYGYISPDDMMNKVNASAGKLYVDPEWQGEFIRLMNEHGSVRGYQTRTYRQDKSIMWVLKNAKTLYNDKGVPLFYEGTIHDVTHRKQTEDALRRSQRFIEGVANASPAILYVYDLIAERYLYVNHQVSKVLGYSTEEVITMGPHFLETAVHPEDRELLRERTQQLRKGGEGQTFLCEYRMINKEGKLLQLQCRETVFTRTSDGDAEQIIGMALDISDRKEVRDELIRSREQLRALSARLQLAREEERLSIAREVHDELGQSLTALGIDLGGLRSRCAKLPAESSGPVLQKIDEMAVMIDPMVKTVQKVASKLRPPILDEFGLVAAIEWQAREFEKRCGIRCQISMGWRYKITEQDPSTAIFRIFQEILTNIVRHAQATKAYVRMRENSRILSLTVTDNGRGITEGQKLESLGVLGMRERALTFGGTVEINGAPGMGTTVTVHIPLAELKRVKAPPRITSLQK
ncbi:MAG: PAS domain S-box protein [Gloeobacteraceae cyanobacterium ES-bin-144]|nr:PAS domain S-box protein [Verrucomicrobiales bacterium]